GRNARATIVGRQHAAVVAGAQNVETGIVLRVITQKNLVSRREILLIAVLVTSPLSLGAVNSSD
ncbi:MAG: hypothetical protein AB7K41_03395, partial [Bdellovibrionales bacterium]